MAEPVKIAIVLEAGSFSACLTAGVPVEFVLIEYEPHPDEESRTVDVPQESGGTARAIISTGTAEAGGAFVLNAFTLAEEAEAAEAEEAARPPIPTALKAMGFAHEIGGGGSLFASLYLPNGWHIWATDSDGSGMPAETDFCLCAYPPEEGEGEGLPPPFDIRHEPGEPRSAFTLERAAVAALAFCTAETGS